MAQEPKSTEAQADEFAAFYLDDTSVVEIDLPNGEPMLYKGEQVRVYVFGPSTKQYAKAKDLMDKEAAKRVLNAMGQKGRKRDDEDKEADEKFLTAITKEIENFPFPGGPAAVYREPRLKYIADQVRSHLNDLGNFYPGGAKN